MKFIKKFETFDFNQTIPATSKNVLTNYHFRFIADFESHFLCKSLMRNFVSLIFYNQK